MLLAIDAPLGWPIPLRSIAQHEAGRAIAAEANAMFRRGTDRRIAERLGKQSLDVGADRIARTAHASLRLLEELRERTGNQIPLAWSPSSLSGVSAIEVYPAASLRAWGVPSRPYKKPVQRSAREEILGALPLVLGADALSEPVLGDADVLDAVICTLCAADFIAGRCEPPLDDHEARVEGWIWVAVA